MDAEFIHTPPTDTELFSVTVYAGPEALKTAR
jgi:hypothetical protein